VVDKANRNLANHLAVLSQILTAHDDPLVIDGADLTDRWVAASTSRVLCCAALRAVMQYCVVLCPLLHVGLHCCMLVCCGMSASKACGPCLARDGALLLASTTPLVWPSSISNNMRKA
jgi:hypothetical protein